MVAINPIFKLGRLVPKLGQIESVVRLLLHTGVVLHLRVTELNLNSAEFDAPERSKEAVQMG